MANHDSAIKKPRALTTKQRSFIKAKLEGKTTTAAAQEAYGISYDSARALGSENMRKLSIQEAINAEYERQGISLAALIKPIADGLKAERTVIIGKAEDSFADQVPDHSIRIAAAKLGGQWLGIGKETDGGTTNYNFVNIATDHKDQFGL